MSKTSSSVTASKGFILLPTLIMLFALALALFALNQDFLVHVRLTKETQLYFNAENQANNILPKLETNLSLNLDPSKPANPENQSALLNHINTWPKLNDNISAYSQLIHQQKQMLYFDSLINVSDNQAEQRALFELLSSCTLEQHRCYPVQLTLIQ